MCKRKLVSFATLERVVRGLLDCRVDRWTGRGGKKSFGEETRADDLFARKEPCSIPPRKPREPTDSQPQRGSPHSIRSHPRQSGAASWSEVIGRWVWPCRANSGSMGGGGTMFLLSGAYPSGPLVRFLTGDAWPCPFLHLLLTSPGEVTGLTG